MLYEVITRHHGDTEIVSKRVEGDLHRYTYREAHARSRRLAKALGRLGLKMHDRAGTLAWNGYRHFEVYYAVAGTGSVIHTINPRLFPEQIVYIANHAEDQVLFFDLTFLPRVEKLAPIVITSYSIHYTKLYEAPAGGCSAAGGSTGPARAGAFWRRRR